MQSPHLDRADEAHDLAIDLLSESFEAERECDRERADRLREAGRAVQDAAWDLQACDEHAAEHPAWGPALEFLANNRDFHEALLAGRC